MRVPSQEGMGCNLRENTIEAPLPGQLYSNLILPFGVFST
jgi:hypothetical protein